MIMGTNTNGFFRAQGEPRTLRKLLELFPPTTKPLRKLQYSTVPVN